MIKWTILALALAFSGCKKPSPQDDLPSYSDMGAAEDAQKALTKP